MELIIYGNGEMAKLIYHYFKTDTNYKLVAFCADECFIKEKFIFGLPVLPFEKIETLCPAEMYVMFVAIGYSNMKNRIDMYMRAKEKKYTLISYIHSKVSYDITNNIGENNAILNNVTIEPFSSIGNNNIIWSNVVLCHHSIIKDHSFIASQSLLGGFSLIDNNCFIGYSTTILQNINISEETLIGAKSLVNKNTEAHSKYMGIPAKKISTLKNGILIK